MNTASVIIPCFTGFYESIWHNSDTEYYLAQDIQDNCEIPFDFQHLDDWYLSDDYYDQVGLAYTAEFQDLVQTYLRIDLEIHFDCIHRPRYYNYATDQIYATFAWSEDYDLRARLLALMEKHRDALTTIIRENHSSYDGFFSTMDNEYEKWCESIREDGDDRYLSYIIMYLLQLETRINDLDEYLFQFVDVEPYNYFEPTTDEAKAEYDHYLNLINQQQLIAA